MQTADGIENRGRFADLVHRVGTAAATKINRKIESREEFIRKSEQQHEAALAKLQAERAAALSAQERLESLQIDVERVQDEFIQAKSVYSTCASQLASAEEMLLGGWGNPSVIEKLGGLNYLNIVNLRAALEDFPRVQAHLDKKLERAQKALNEFERTLS